LNRHLSVFGNHYEKTPIVFIFDPWCEITVNREADPKTEISGAEKGFMDSWLELIVAVVLGLATLGSAWSAYESVRWQGIQTFRLAESIAAGRRAAEKLVHANQVRGADLILLEAYLRALAENNSRLADFLFQRFRPEFKVATEAWLKTQPLKNPSAPPSPFVMKEYSLAVEKELHQARQEEAAKFTEARKANAVSDTYLLLTVLFSVALFLGGIAAAFKRRKIRGTVLALSFITMTSGAICLALLPLATE
jgi:hypothetical protein